MYCISSRMDNASGLKTEAGSKFANVDVEAPLYPRANGAKHRSGRKPRARVTNSALAEFKVVAHGRWYVLTDLNIMADYRVE